MAALPRRLHGTPEVLLDSVVRASAARAPRSDRPDPRGRHHHIGVEKVTFTVVDRVTVTGFLEHMRATKSWTPSTYNQRLACIRSFFIYAAAAEPTLTIYLADLAAIPRLKAPAAAPVKYMSTDAVTALLAAPDPGTRIGLRDQF